MNNVRNHFFFLFFLFHGRKRRLKIFFGKKPMSGCCPKSFSTLQLKLSEILMNSGFSQIWPMPPFSHSALENTFLGQSKTI